MTSPTEAELAIIALACTGAFLIAGGVLWNMACRGRYSLFAYGGVLLGASLVAAGIAGVYAALSLVPA